jgi:hypothetical protein
MEEQEFSVGSLQRRGSYFYVIDAFIASIIIIGALIIIIARFFAQPQPQTAFYTAEDFLSTIETTKVLGYDDGTVRAWVTAWNLSDSSRTLLQQLALFELQGNQGNASGNLSSALGNRTPTNVNIEILVNGNQRYIREQRLKDEADTLLTSKRIVLLRRNASDMYDPALIEVRTWQ